MDFFATITLLGIVQGFFMGALLILSKGPNRRANRFLGTLFICYSLSILHFFLDRSGLYVQVPHLMRIGLPVLFLFGPLFYFYVKVLTDRTVQLHGRDLLHAIPFLVLRSALMMPFYLSSTEEKLAEIDRLKEFAAEPAFLLVATHPSHPCLRLYDRGSEDPQAVRSEDPQHEVLPRTHQPEVATRSGTTLYLAVFGFIQLLTTLQAFGIQTVELYHFSIPLIVTAIIYGLGYMGLRQPEIFSPAEEMAAGKKYEKSTLTPDLTRDYSVPK